MGFRKEPLAFLLLFWGILGVSGSSFGQWFMSKGFMYTVNPSSHLADIAKSQQTYSQFTYQVPGTNKDSLSLKDQPEGVSVLQGRSLICSPLACRRVQQAVAAHYLWRETLEL